MRIGFLVNQIDSRGTGNAVYDYAHYNEELLDNESVIFSFPDGAHDQDQLQRYLFRFGKIWFAEKLNDFNLDALYHIKSGENDGFGKHVNCPYLVHSVFTVDRHGTVCATISSWMAGRYSVPWVPHIVSLPDIEDNLRKDLGIPEDAVVFGRHGGIDTFDIPFVWGAIDQALKERDDIYFLFMNTQIPTNLYDMNRVIEVSPTVNPYQKRAFINTCDAMIHARSRGETFGIAVGEFDICDKPIVTYAFSPEKAHNKQIGNHYIYTNENDVLQVFRFPKNYWANWYGGGGYKIFTPENVMKQFKEVFLDGI